MDTDRPVGGAYRAARRVVRAWRMLRVKLEGSGTVSVGENFTISGGAEILSPDHFKVGDNVRIARHFFCETNAVIGSDSLISSNVSFVGNDHAIDAEVPMSESVRLPPAEVVLEGDNLIGHGTLVLGNVRIGRGTIVGAGSMVTRDLPGGWVCFGRPAVPQRRR